MRKQNYSTNSNDKIRKDIQLPNEEIEKMIQEGFYQSQMQKADNIDVDINHLEKIFTNETYYLAMKIVPLLERKVLYLSYIENTLINVLVNIELVLASILKDNKIACILRYKLF